MVSRLFGMRPRLDTRQGQGGAHSFSAAAFAANNGGFIEIRLGHSETRSAMTAPLAQYVLRV